MFRICTFLVVAISVVSCAAISYSHGPAEKRDPSSIELLTKALPDKQEIEWYYTGWLNVGANVTQSGANSGGSFAGVIVVTRDKLIFETWDDATGYHTVRVTNVCDITDIIRKDKKRGGQIVVVVTDQPDSYQVATKMSVSPMWEEGKQLADLLRRKYQACS
jgi:predicted amino acid racemase